ncbi:IS200/IS605 family transposase [Azotobacter chroococcum]|uniref:IS200/IS605 family transposase n=1 Tax=Azotobacter chroococcum TaxID=353 RepID=UPI0035EF11DC
MGAPDRGSPPGDHPSAAGVPNISRVLGRSLQNFGEADHVHLRVTYPPKVALSKRVNSVKGASSRRMKQLHPELVAPAYRSNALRSPSYFAGSVGGAPLAVFRQYIEQQARPL